MNIAFCLNRKIVRYLPVTFASIRANHTEASITCYVVHSDLHEEDKDMLIAFAKKFKLTLHILHVDYSLFEKIATPKGYKTNLYQLPIETCFRFILPNVLPQTIDRVLYLDIDIVVDGDLYGLYSMDFQDKAVVVTYGMHGYDSLSPALPPINLPPESGLYFNAGVMLLNLVYLRKNISFAHYVQASESIDSNLFSQAILNYLFWDNALYVSALKFNYAYRTDPNGLLLGDSKPSIIHYASSNKPWDFWCDDDLHIDSVYGSHITPHVNHINGIWWKYAKMCPQLYDELYSQMCDTRNILLGNLAGAAYLVRRAEKYLGVYEKLYQTGMTEQLDKYLKQYDCVGVYGYGNLGAGFTKRLKASGVSVKVVIDKKYTEPLSEDGTLFTSSLQDAAGVDIVIITALMDADAISLELKEHTSAKVIALDALLGKK